MPRLVFRPEAHQEAQEARDWYEGKAHGLGLDFTRAIDATTAAIKRFPESFTLVAGPYRQAVLRRFPYSIIYEIIDSEIVRIALFPSSHGPRCVERPNARCLTAAYLHRR